MKWCLLALIAFLFTDTVAARLGPANYGYELSYATMGKRELDRLCGGDSMPTLLLQRLTIQSGYSPKFEAGTPVGPPLSDQADSQLSPSG